MRAGASGECLRPPQPGLRPAHSVGVAFAGSLYPFRPRALRLRSVELRGPTPAVEATSSAEVAPRRVGWRRLAAPAAHPSGVLLAASTHLFGLAPTPPSGFAAGRRGRRLFESQFSPLGIATPPTRQSRAGRSLYPKRRLQYLAPLGCVCAGAANTSCDQKKHMRPTGSLGPAAPHRLAPTLAGARVSAPGG